MVVGLEGPWESLALAKGALGWEHNYSGISEVFWRGCSLAAITASNHSIAGHSGVGMASCCVNSLCSVTWRPGWGLLWMNMSCSTWHRWCMGSGKKKTGLKCMEPEISMWKILPLIRGCKFLSRGLIPLLSMPHQHESSLVRNRLDNAACAMKNIRYFCLGVCLFWRELWKIWFITIAMFLGRKPIAVPHTVSATLTAHMWSTHDKRFTAFWL